ncbi:MAG: U32 family peptidase [archaeon]|nr:U32 family peptidase [archaeon]
MKKPELLAPAGDFPSLIAAIESGADAVYFGLKEFNMRDSAKNFYFRDLKRISELCGKNVKKYLTLNTIIYDSELKRAENTIKKVKNYVDAIICWDLSVILLCKKYKIPFHVSTQASVSNTSSAEFYKKLGAERVVLARELNLKQIRKISRIIDVECFIHGAMCVSISGRCFTSQFMRCKSANRGQCTHPCRRAYIIKDEEGNELKLENNKVMSAKDLCALPFISRLKKAGISAFKIEGRNRGAEYVKTVVSVYRKAVDKKLSKEEVKEGIKQLSQVYNRGFSSGFYLGIPTSDDFATTEDSEGKESKQVVGRIVNYWQKIGIAHLKVTAHPIKLGDELYIIGNKTGIKRVKIGEMQINHKPIASVKKGQEIGIKLPLCRANDMVYIIIKRE